MRCPLQSYNDTIRQKLLNQGSGTLKDRGTRFHRHGILKLECPFVGPSDPGCWGSGVGSKASRVSHPQMSDIWPKRPRDHCSRPSLAPLIVSSNFRPSYKFYLASLILTKWLYPAGVCQLSQNRLSINSPLLVFSCFLDRPKFCTTIKFQKDNRACVCYFFLKTGLTHSQATKECAAHGARLPEIYRARENSIVAQIMVRVV